MIWIGILLFFALVLFLLEIFVPGGFLALGGVVLIMAGSVLAFIEYGPLVGLFVFIGGLLVSLLFFFLEIKVLAFTKAGKSLFIHQQVSSGSSGLGDTSHLVGKAGETITPMSPGGKVRIDGKEYAAVSLDGFLPKGRTVVVKDADSFTIRVSNR